VHDGDDGRRFFTDQRQGRTENDRKQQHLQHIAGSERTDHRIRDDFHHEVGKAAASYLIGSFHITGQGAGVQGVRIDVHADARMEYESQQQPQHQGQRGHYFKVDQRLQADPADFFQLAGAVNAMYHYTEHDHRDDHLDQLDKTVAQRLQAFSEFREQHPDCDSHDKCYEHLAKQ